MKPTLPLLTLARLWDGEILDQLSAPSLQEVLKELLESSQAPELQTIIPV